MSKRSVSIRLSSLGLSIMLAACSLTPTFAEGTVSVYQKLGQYETVLFGKADTSMPVEKRLQNLEKQLFGKANKDGSSSERLVAIEKVMSGSKYMPPIAPEMDRSEFAPEPKMAPENPELSTKEINDPRDAPLPADASDRTKGLLRQAMQAYSQGKIPDAERLYQQVLAVDFRNADANYNLGAIAESKNDLKSAQRYYSAALKANPGDGDTQDALRAVQQKLKMQPASATASAPTGAGSGASAASSADSLEGAPVTAGDKAIALEAAQSYKKGDFDDAIQKLAFLARKNPYDANTQFALGQAFRGKGDMPNAAKHLRSAAQLDPRNDLYVKTLNDLLSQSDDPQTASAGGDPAYGGAASTGGRQGGNNDVQPFVGLPASNNDSFNNNTDMAAAENYMRRNSGNGMMMGSVSGFGGPMGGMGMGGMGMGGMGMGIPMLGTASGGTRLTRVMGAGLSGAAMGAMMSRGQPGGMSRGAMRGAMYGSLFGLMMGGF